MIIYGYNGRGVCGVFVQGQRELEVLDRGGFKFGPPLSPITCLTLSGRKGCWQLVSDLVE